MRRDRTNPIASVISALQSRKNPLFSTLFLTLFAPSCPIERTGNKSHPKTLFAAMDTFTAYLVILAPAILAEKEAPFLYAAFLPACFKAESDFHYRLVPYASGNSTLCHSKRFLLWGYSRCRDFL